MEEVLDALKERDEDRKYGRLRSRKYELTEERRKPETEKQKWEK